MEKTAVWQGILALMVLKCLEVPGPQHGYGIARRIEQTSENARCINHGTLYPVLLKLEREGSISSEWWQTAGIIARFIALRGEAQ